MNANQPMAFVADDTLADDLLKLAAAAGSDLERVSDLAAARSRWFTAPLVLVDRQAAAECHAERLPRRPALFVAATDPVPDELWRQAVDIGAERVLSLPGAEEWLVSVLADAAEGPPRGDGKVLTVVGARGGAGASVFAVAVGLTALKESTNALIVDCDPRGGGLDVVLGAEAEEGLRWPDMQLNAGRIAATALHMALPARKRGDARMTLLSSARTGEAPAAEAVAAVVEAGRRAGEIVVCDIPRHLDHTAFAAIDRADLTAIVTPAEVRACVTAKQLAGELARRGAETQLIVRAPSPGSLPLREIPDFVGVPVLAYMNEEPGLARALERGAFSPRRRGPLSRAAIATLTELKRLPPRPTPGPDPRQAA